MHHYSIATAKNNLSRIVQEAEEGETVHPADALHHFLMNKDFENVDIAPSVFEDLRMTNKVEIDQCQ